ncbi:MAG: trypsin-like peptidase domain-containing protein [Eubacteriales bacterium]|nr:trypsin-like peptidase domain-containing protein [Eubacteriales bacterium]
MTAKHVRQTSSPALKVIAIILTCAALAGITTLFVNSSAYAAEADALSPADIYEQNVESTVGITTSAETVNYWGYPANMTASGSGFIISEDGYVLTNFHVIDDSDEVTVKTYNGDSYDAEIIGYDESNDIAVLKIDGENLKPVTIGDSDALRVGDDVLAIGNPLGELTFSLTKGIVSAVGRDVTIETGITMSLIQTDCAINSGNSGGALFNMKGEVIGITNAKYSSSASSASIDNIGFAIPINSLTRIYSSIIENGFIVKPYIGITGQTVSDEIKETTGLKSGVRVYSVTEDSPASEAKLAAGDVIVTANGKEIIEFSDLSGMVSASEPGDELKLEVYRQGEILDITVVVGSDTKPALEEEEEEDFEDYEDFDGQQYQGRQGSGQQPYSGFGDFFGDGGMQDFFDYYFFGR